MSDTGLSLVSASDNVALHTTEIMFVMSQIVFNIKYLNQDTAQSTQNSQDIYATHLAWTISYQIKGI